MKTAFMSLRVSGIVGILLTGRIAKRDQTGKPWKLSEATVADNHEFSGVLFSNPYYTLRENGIVV